ncbi:MAG TPA: hypothetical protein VL025_18865 [Thermoanaerobaculia bacterium]|nr:hypothetical protein [Thermoanaerobaculia bacterium]
MKKRLLPLALLLSLAAFLSAPQESRAHICPYDQECVFGCQEYCEGQVEPCFTSCIHPGCCIL